MVLALVGDSTTTTSMRLWRLHGRLAGHAPKEPARRVSYVTGSERCKRDPVARMPLDPPLELQLEQRLLHLCRGCMALAYQFVNQQRLDPQPFLQPADQIIGRRRC